MTPEYLLMLGFVYTTLLAFAGVWTSKNFTYAGMTINKRWFLDFRYIASILWAWWGTYFFHLIW